MSLMSTVNHTYEMILNVQEFNEVITKPQIVEQEIPTLNVVFETINMESEIETIIEITDM